MRTWALGSRELRELRTESAAKPITDSNLCLRGPAQRPADRIALLAVVGDVLLARSGCPRSRGGGPEGGAIAEAPVRCPAKRSGLPVDGGRGNRGGCGLKM